MKLTFLLLFALLFSACNLTESKEDIAAKKKAEQKAFEEKVANTKEVQIQQIEAQKSAELAKIEAQTDLAKLEKEQMLEKIRLEAQAKKEQLLLEQKKEREAFEARLREIEHADAMEIKRYLLFIFLIVLIIASYFIYLYFKQRHENKLRSYQDNLDKYFHQQENMTKMRIAEKIIDTVASGKLDKEQELELIRALNATNTPPPQETKLLNDTSEDVEIIEPSKDSH